MRILYHGNRSRLFHLKRYDRSERGKSRHRYYHRENVQGSPHFANQQQRGMVRAYSSGSSGPDHAVFFRRLYRNYSFNDTFKQYFSGNGKRKARFSYQALYRNVKAAGGREDNREDGAKMPGSVYIKFCFLYFMVSLYVNKRSYSTQSVFVRRHRIDNARSDILLSAVRLRNIRGNFAYRAYTAHYIDIILKKRPWKGR